MNTNKTSRDEYLRLLYEIYQVGDGLGDRIAFWERINGKIGGTDTSELGDEFNLAITEGFFADEDCEDAVFSSEREIFVDKFYRDNGVSFCPAFRLYWMKHNFPVNDFISSNPHLATALNAELLEHLEQRFIVAEADIVEE